MYRAMSIRKFWIWLKIASDWIDDRLFPLPKNSLEQIVEQEANIILGRIKSCRRNEQLNHVVDLIEDFRMYHIHSAQVKGWYDSLNLELINKYKEINDNY